ncbi:MAG TPA: glycosyltransferase family 39 protein, partial [Puia sp.]
MQSTVHRPASSSAQNPGVVWLVYGLALVKFVLPFLLQHPVYEPHRDEFLYLAEGRHPAWGYLGAPPLLSLLSWGTNLFGAGFFWIKFWPALFGAMTYLLTGRMILLLGGGRFAVALGFLPFVFGIFLRMHFILSPDFLAVYFETLMVYGLVRFHRNGKPGGLYLTGMAFGLGVLSHYSVLVFAAWLVIALLLTPERKT